jgi:hypothetical protein
MSSGLLRRTCSWPSETQKALTTKAREGKSWAPFPQQDFDLRQAWRLIALTTMQKTFAGMKPNCSVRNPMMHMITLLTPARAQPSQHRRPTRIVEATVKIQDR